MKSTNLPHQNHGPMGSLQIVKTVLSLLIDPSNDDGNRDDDGIIDEYAHQEL